MLGVKYPQILQKNVRFVSHNNILIFIYLFIIILEGLVMTHDNAYNINEYFSIYDGNCKKFSMPRSHIMRIVD